MNKEIIVTDPNEMLGESLKLTKNTRGYTWEIRLRCFHEEKINDDLIDRMEKINNNMINRFEMSNPLIEPKRKGVGYLQDDE